MLTCFNALNPTKKKKITFGVCIESVALYDVNYAGQALFLFFEFVMCAEASFLKDRDLWGMLS